MAAKSQVACGIVDMLEVPRAAPLLLRYLPFVCRVFVLFLLLLLVLDLGHFIDILELSYIFQAYMAHYGSIMLYPMNSIRCFCDALLPLLPGQSVR